MNSFAFARASSHPPAPVALASYCQLCWFSGFSKTYGMGRLLESVHIDQEWLCSVAEQQQELVRAEQLPTRRSRASWKVGRIDVQFATDDPEIETSAACPPYISPPLVFRRAISMTYFVEAKWTTCSGLEPLMLESVRQHDGHAWNPIFAGH